MMRIATPVIVAAFAAMAIVPASAQVAAPQSVALETRSASRALDAVPAVFAVARNLEGVEIEVGVDSVANGFSDLAGQPAAQEQLTAALGSYGFEGYEDWAATVRTVFSTYAFIRSRGPNDPSIEEATRRILDDPSIPRSQKDSIVESMSEPSAELPEIGAAPPTQENLAVVVALVPHIESTIEMMRAMQ